MILMVITVVAILLALNGIFVAAEFAIVTARRTAIHQLAEEGSGRARRVALVLGDARRQDRFIATVQLGITVASLGLGMYGERQIAAMLSETLAGAGAGGWLASHALASGIAIAALTYLHIVLGEMVPKAVSLARPERVALWLTPFILVIQTAVHPIVSALNGIGNGLLRLLGVERRYGDAQTYTAAELQHIVHESEAGGLVGKEEAHVFDRLVEYGELTAREVMVPRVRMRGAEIRSTRQQLLELVASHPHTRYPVYAHDLDHIVGMIHVRELARSLQGGQGIRQGDIRTIPFVPGSATLDTVLSAMRAAHVQIAIVMDEHGGTDGLITTDDLFEEVVGELDQRGAPSELFVDALGILHAVGTVRLDEVGDRLGVELEHPEVDTVSGLILALLQRPPRIGDEVAYGGFGFQVVGVRGHGVSGCRITPVSA